MRRTRGALRGLTRRAAHTDKVDAAPVPDQKSSSSGSRVTHPLPSSQPSFPCAFGSSRVLALTQTNQTAMAKSSPQSFEKRQRERNKQNKRAEKLERRLIRSEEKRYERAERDGDEEGMKRIREKAEQNEQGW